jgi:quinol monooxygenase YgiN
MGEIRILVSHKTRSPEEADQITRERVERCLFNETQIPGCLQFEVFRSVVHPENFVLIERWASEAQYSEFLEKHSLIVNSPPAPLPPGREMTVEYYHRQTYVWVDGAWQVSEPERRSPRVRW